MSELIYSNDWGYFRLTNLAEYHNGYSFRPSDWSESGLPIIRIEQINNPNGFCDRYSGSPPKINLIDDGDLIFSWSATLKVVIWKGGPAVLNQHLFRVDEKNNFDKRYIFFLLDFHMESLGGNSHGSTMKHIKRSELDKFRVRVPNLKLQQKIATILTSIDTAIEKTEALIEKYQQIKSGLMHDLFTRGVLPNGQLRPTREQAPELYQETKIGWFPRGWGEPIPLEDLLADVSNNLRSGPFGSALLKSELVEDGIPFLGIDNIHVERFESTFKRYVTKKKFLELSKYSVRQRDVAITIMGTVGRCCVIPENIDRALSSKHLWVMTFDLEKVIPELICWQLNYSSWAKTWFRRETQGGIMDAIQSKTLRRLKLPVPSIDEQYLIFERFNKMNAKLTAEESNLAKLKLQKLGLMQDLLTGKVPVTVSENADQEEAYA
jgi:type I restriction enzyme S subunit